MKAIAGALILVAIAITWHARQPALGRYQVVRTGETSIFLVDTTSGDTFMFAPVPNDANRWIPVATLPHTNRLHSF